MNAIELSVDSQSVQFLLFSCRCWKWQLNPSKVKELERKIVELIYSYYIVIVTQNMSVYDYLCMRLNNQLFFHQNRTRKHTASGHGCRWCGWIKIRRSPKLLQFILRRTWISLRDFMANYLVDVETQKHKSQAHVGAGGKVKGVSKSQGFILLRPL